MILNTYLVYIYIYIYIYSLTCTSANVVLVYLAQCVDCNLQGVGSSINFKKRLANYKSHIWGGKLLTIDACRR